ncbi:MAG: hypothetical protein JST40_12775 [Armatimonadetes bacterium]|nr:hypothetical protein [Armatimonadota bacterium]
MNTPRNVDEERIRAYYKAISAKGKKVMAEKRAQGEVMHKAPLGYKNARDPAGRSILVPDPETYPLVQEAKRLHRSGMSIRKICKVMEKRGLRSKRNKTIAHSAMHRALFNFDDVQKLSGSASYCLD